MPADIHDLERLVGKAALLLRVGPAHADSLLFRSLVALGVLEQLPSERPLADEIAHLPWGSGSVAAPEPDRPSSIDGPWPQKPILRPDLPPPVLKIDAADAKDHALANVTRYLGQIILHTPVGAVLARFGRRVEPVSDDEFESILTKSVFAQFLLPMVSAGEKELFAADLAAEPEAIFGTIDLSGFGDFTPLPGVYAVPTVVLLRQRSDVDWAVVAIRCGEHVFHAGDGARWELAKYFVLQGAQSLLLCIAHPRLHLPLDALNAITRSLLPASHRISRLLAPHFLYTLGLHKALIHHQRGAIHNNQREVSVAFTFETASMHDGVALGLSGCGDEAYPAYNLFGVHIGTHTEYGRYRLAWYQHTLEFTRSIVATLEPGDPDITRWAGEASTWVEGFPNGTQIWDEDVLAQTLATIITTVSVFHTADHDSYSRVPQAKMPLRLRQPPPDDVNPTTLDRNALVSREDSYRHYLAMRMYIRPVIRTTLSSVDYRFRSPVADQAAKTFVAGMAALDACWGPHNFATSDRIATSVQS
jgi:hypothetical protein